MKEAQALTYEVMGEDVYIATLSRMGLDHVERRTIIPGIKRPSPSGQA